MSPPASQAAGQHDAGPAPLFAEQRGKEDWLQDIQDRLPSLDSLPQQPLRQQQASPAATAAAADTDVASPHLHAKRSSQNMRAYHFISQDAVEIVVIQAKKPSQALHVSYGMMISQQSLQY